MALKPCPGCGKEISQDARACPHCGHRQGLVFYQIGGFLALAVILLIFLTEQCAK